jgi:hypothetical protein
MDKINRTETATKTLPGSPTAQRTALQKGASLIAHVVRAFAGPVGGALAGHFLLGGEGAEVIGAMVGGGAAHGASAQIVNAFKAAGFGSVKDIELQMVLHPKFGAELMRKASNYPERDVKAVLKRLMGPVVLGGALSGSEAK